MRTRNNSHVERKKNLKKNKRERDRREPGIVDGVLKVKTRR